MKMENTLHRRFVVLWAIGLVSVFYNAEAALKTTFIEDLCYKKLSGVIDLRYEKSGILMSAPRLNMESSLDCQVTLLPPRDTGVVLSIFRYDVESNDLLTIQDSDHHVISLLSYGSFADERKSVVSDGKMVIRYKRSNATTQHPRVGFQFTFTNVKASPCSDDDFKCQNGKCVLKDYVCDGHNHCGDSSDQKKCVPTGSQISSERDRYGSNLTGVWLISIIVGAVILLIVVIVFIVVLVRRSKQKKAVDSSPGPSGQTAGDIPFQSVSATVPVVSASPQPATVPAVTASQQPATVPEAPQGVSLYNRVRRSISGPKNVTTEDLPKQHTSAEVYQVPSMYPSLDQFPSAPEIDGIDNPEFRREDY